MNSVLKRLTNWKKMKLPELIKLFSDIYEYQERQVSISKIILLSSQFKSHITQFKSHITQFKSHITQFKFHISQLKSNMSSMASAFVCHMVSAHHQFANGTYFITIPLVLKFSAF